MECLFRAGVLGYWGLDEGKSLQVIDMLSGPLGVLWAGSPWRWGLLLDFALIYPGINRAAPLAAESLAISVQSLPSPHPLWVCHVDLYRAFVGDTLGVRDRVRTLIPRFLKLNLQPECPTLVEALVESHDRQREDTPALDSLEARVRRAPNYFPGNIATVLLTRLLRQRGQFARALAATDLRALYSQFYLMQRCPLLKEEGDLAVIVGDTTRAIAAYRKYLTLRVDPDDGMRAEVDSVRDALEALLR